MSSEFILLCIGKGLIYQTGQRLSYGRSTSIPIQCSTILIMAKADHQ